MLAAGCASTRTGLSHADRLALYRAHAREPVGDFRFFGSVNGWTPVDDDALVVWTKPSEAYLLELSGPCTDLEWAPAITLTNQASRVYARFDDVLVLGGPRNTMRMPCRIQVIRPLDVKALRQTEKDMREAKAGERAPAQVQPSGT